MPDSESKKEWMRKNKIILTIGLMRTTENDIISHLEKQENKSGYIKRLIREDMAKNK